MQEDKVRTSISITAWVALLVGCNSNQNIFFSRKDSISIGTNNRRCVTSINKVIFLWAWKAFSEKLNNFGFGIWNEAGQRLIEFCQENALVIKNTLFQQDKRRLYTWTSPDGQHQNQIDCIFGSQRWRNSI